MIKIIFTTEFLEWVAQQMRANDTGLDAYEFATELFHRAFIGRGAEVLQADPLLLEACELALLELAHYEYTDLPGGDTVRKTVWTLREALRQARTRGLPGAGDATLAAAKGETL